MSSLTTTLNQLIETLNDGKLGFSTAAEDAKRPDLKQLFQQFASERANFAAQLQKHVQQLGEKAEDAGSVAGDLHRGWINLKAAVASREDLAILEECERGEDSAVSAYREALSADLGALRSDVEAQFTKVKAAHDQVRNLRDSLKSVPA